MVDSLKDLTNTQKHLEHMYAQSLQNVEEELYKVIEGIVEALEKKDIDFIYFSLAINMKEDVDLEQVIKYLKDACQWPSSIIVPDRFVQLHEFINNSFQLLHETTQVFTYCVANKAFSINDNYNLLSFNFISFVNSLSLWSEEIQFILREPEFNAYTISTFTL